MPDAHSQPIDIHLLAHYPAHEPRKSDPHYRIFEETRKRLERQGLMKCAVPGCTYPGPMELHHDKVEFALQGGVDLEKFNEYYGLHLKDDEEFKDYIEGPGNLEVLCPIHHRTKLGVHELPGPFWDILRVWRADLPPPAEVL